MSHTTTCSGHDNRFSLTAQIVNHNYKVSFSLNLKKRQRKRKMIKVMKPFLMNKNWSFCPWENMIKWKEKKTFYCSFVSSFNSFFFISPALFLFSIRFYCISAFMTHLLFLAQNVLKRSRLDFFHLYRFQRNDEQDALNA